MLIAYCNTKGDDRYKNVFDRFKINFPILKQRERTIDTLKMNDNKNYQQSRRLRNNRSIGSAIKSHGRQTKVAVNQGIIKKDVDYGFSQRSPNQKFGLVCPNQQSISHHIQIEARQTPDAD